MVLRIGGESGKNRALISWNYLDKEDLTADTLLIKEQIGSTWGIAYDKKKKATYLSAFLRRHVGFIRQ